MDCSVDRGVNCEVAAHKSAWPGDFRTASLADENFASFNFLTAKTLDSKTLAGIIVDIFAGSASFDM